MIGTDDARRGIGCTGYLEHPFKNLAVSLVIDLELLGKLTPTLTGFRTELPSSQHRVNFKDGCVVD
jgi:hypothetical protein